MCVCVCVCVCAYVCIHISMYTYIYIYMLHQHHHQIVLIAQILLTLFRHPSLSDIALGQSCRRRTVFTYCFRLLLLLLLLLLSFVMPPWASPFFIIFSHQP